MSAIAEHPRRYAIWLSAAEIEALFAATDRQIRYLKQLLDSGMLPDATKDIYAEQLAQNALAQAALSLGQP